MFGWSRLVQTVTSVSECGFKSCLDPSFQLPVESSGEQVFAAVAGFLTPARHPRGGHDSLFQESEPAGRLASSLPAPFPLRPSQLHSCLSVLA